MITYVMTNTMYIFKFFFDCLIFKTVWLYMRFGFIYFEYKEELFPLKVSSKHFESIKHYL